ncbi:BTAD domain-containing putative transcriptional regulator [Rhodococcus sp. NPDC056743]|uniref:BTAD domain-containing putative transcriptional regulator n=1 Tax=Rhodococcus sp. NPDC056743 TaxID=3345934 RepID=UPI00366F0A4D
MPLNVELFGPVVVRLDGAALSLGGPIPRAIVARLALRPGRRFSAEELIDDIWECPPPSAHASLRAHISRLRSVLGERLVGGRSGYELMDVERVDMLDFASAVESGLSEQSSACLELAERIWTAEPFEGLKDLPFVSAYSTQLQGQRRAAAELLGRLRLEAGDFLGAIATLTPLVSENGINELPVALLARALARAGRTSDALATIDVHRRRVAEELGLDPSPALAVLRGDIVRHSSSVAAAPLGRIDVERHGFPLPLTGFIGRKRELEAIDQARLRARLITVTGSGGVGKTRLAVESTRRIRDDVDDGQWMLEMAPLTAEGELVSALAEVVRVPVPSIEGISGRLSEGRNLLVLDNAEHLRPAVTGLCQELLARCRGLAILVTSREPLSIPGEHVIAIGPMLGTTLDDAVELFSSRADDAHPGFSDNSDMASVRMLCELLDGIPLGIELAAARLSIQSLPDVLRSIRLRPGESRSLAATTTRHSSMHSTVAWSVELLAEPERDLLAQIGRFQGPITLEAISGICRLPEGCSVHELTASLTRKSLLSIDSGGQGVRVFKMLEATKAFARAMPVDDAESWGIRHREWFAMTVDAIAPQLFSRMSAFAHEMLDLMRPDMLRALNEAISSREGYSALRLAGGQGWHWVRRGMLTEGREWLDKAMLAADGDRGVDIDSARARVLHAECILAYMSGDIPNARRCAVSCADYATRAADRNLMAVARGILAYWEALFGDVIEAKSLMNNAFELAVDVEPWARSETLMTCGQVQRSLGQPAHALDTLSEAEQLARSCGHGWALIPAVGISSKILIDLGRGSDAIARLAPAAARAFADHDPTSTMATLHQSIGAAALIERHHEGAVLHAVVGRLGKRYNFDPLITEPEDSARYLTQIRQSLTHDEWLRAEDVGRNMPLRAAVNMLGSLVSS